MQNWFNLSTKVNYFLLLISFLFLISCKSYQHDPKAHKTAVEFYTQYSNDQYEFSYKTWGNYEPLTSWDSVKKYMPKKDRKRFSKEMFLTGSHYPLLTTSYTNQYIFVYPVTNKNKNQVLERIDSTNRSMERIYKHPTKNYYVHLYIHYIKNLENYSLEHFVEDYKWLFDSVKIGKDYKVATPEDPFNLAREEFFDKRDSTTNYILPVLKLDYNSQNYQRTKEHGVFIQALATFNSFLYRSKKQDSYLNEFRSLSYYKNIDTTSYSFLMHDNEAVDFLVEKCSQNQVVMFNENHFDTQHRLLAIHLLERLYQKGFRFLALEALWEQDSTINKRGFAVQSSGLYTNETNFADLIRQAHKIGFQIIGYDDFTKDREKNQAKNIFDKTIAKDKDAKVLVWAGFEHINEDKFSRKKMAAYFEELSAINPLTIDQTEYIHQTENNWLSIIDTAAIDTAIIDRLMKVDIRLANSFYKFPQKTKEVKYNFSDSIKTELNIDKTEYRGSVKVYNLEEWKITKKAVPFQVVAIENINFANLFLVPNKEYYIEISDSQGGIIFEEELKVK